MVTSVTLEIVPVVRQRGTVIGRRVQAPSEELPRRELDRKAGPLTGSYRNRIVLDRNRASTLPAAVDDDAGIPLVHVEVLPGNRHGLQTRPG